MGKLLAIIILLLLIGSYIIIRTYSLDIKNKADQKTFFKIFIDWIAKLFENVKQVTSLAVKQDWSPVNNTKNA